MRPEAQGSDPRAVPRVTGAGVRSYCRTSDRRRGLKGPGLPPPTGSPWGGLQEGVAPGASLSLALSLEEGLPGLAVEEGPLWEVDHPRPCPVAAKPEGSQSRVRVWLAGGWGREHRGSPGDPPSSGRGHGLIEAWGDSGPPHLAGSPMSGTWGQGRSRSPPPHQVAVFLCGLPSTGWAPCGLNPGPGLQTQPRRWAGQGSAGLGWVLLPGAAGQAARGSVPDGGLGTGWEGPSELDPSEQSPPPRTPARAGDPVPPPSTSLSSRSFLQLFSRRLPTALGGGSRQQPRSTDGVTIGYLVTLDLTILWGSRDSGGSACPSGPAWVPLRSRKHHRGTATPFSERLTQAWPAGPLEQRVDP